MEEDTLIWKILSYWVGRVQSQTNWALLVATVRLRPCIPTGRGSTVTYTVLSPILQGLDDVLLS